MRKLGQNPSEDELIEMISSVDDNGDHEIDFNEFLILMKSRIGERDPEKELRDAFAVFDTDGSGSIDMENIEGDATDLTKDNSSAGADAILFAKTQFAVETLKISGDIIIFLEIGSFDKLISVIDGITG